MFPSLVHGPRPSFSFPLPTFKKMNVPLHAVSSKLEIRRPWREYMPGKTIKTLFTHTEIDSPHGMWSSCTALLVLYPGINAACCFYVAVQNCSMQYIVLVEVWCNTLLSFSQKAVLQVPQRCELF